MPTPQIGGVDIPTSMRDRGHYRFVERSGVRNPEGEASVTGVQMVVWTFPYMTQAELLWWQVQVLGGARSLSTTASLWINDDKTALQSFTTAIVHRPIVDENRYVAGRYHDVEVRITNLEPNVL